MSGATPMDTDAPPSAEAAEDPAAADPVAQRKQVLALGDKKQRVGDTWYAVSKKWYKSWEAFTAFDKKDADIDGGVEALRSGEHPRPGPIDNEDLQSEEVAEALKEGLEEEVTHVWVHSTTWELLAKWYGGGPAFPREVMDFSVNTYTSEKRIVMYPQFLLIQYLDEETGQLKEDGRQEMKKFAKSKTLREVMDTLAKELKGEDEKDNPQVHLWFKFQHLKAMYPHATKKITVKEEELKDEDPDRYVELPDDEDGQTLDDMKLPDGEPVLLERQFDKKWPRSKQVDETKADETWANMQVGDIYDVLDNHNKWYQTMVRGVQEENVAVHYMGWDKKWDEYVPKADVGTRFRTRQTETTRPYRPAKRKTNTYGSYGYTSSSYRSGWSYYSNEEGKPTVKGIVGLRNLGNTCFMNSTIQCLAQSKWLTDYFLSDEYKKHVNRDNPLGWNGKVAEAWAELLKSLFGNKYRTVAPRDFKHAIGEVAPRFMGYSQQDSQELLSFLLDGLHEDLNQIVKKPPTETVESDGRPDIVVAKESWKQYLRRNVSVIVDLLQGQYKSRVVCPDCGRISVTFDPYMFLSVPLPTEKYKVVEYTFVPANVGTARPTVYGTKIIKVADIEMLKQQIGKQLGVPFGELVVSDVWKSKFHREFRDRDVVQDIQRRTDDIHVYHVPNPPVVEEEAAADKGADKGGDKDAMDVDGAANGAANDTAVRGTSYSYDGYGYGGKPKPYVLYSVINQHKVKSKYNYYGKARWEDEPIGVPLWFKVPKRGALTHNDIYTKVFAMIRPFMKDPALGGDDLPFGIYGVIGWNNIVKIEEGSDEELDLYTAKSVKFIVQWTDSSQYKMEFYEERPRDTTAPPKEQRTSVTRDQRAAAAKPISLDACIDAFTEEETLSEHDAWYCSVCKEHKCATKKIDLFSAPDLLIIHLKRFSYTRVWRDRINTLVDFPLEGLDLSKWVQDPTHKKHLVYDLYAVSNHMGGMGGGHYTAFAKSLSNGKWYQLDDSRTTAVQDLGRICSSSAYVLYYQRRVPKELKHRESRIDILFPTAADAE